MGVVRNAYEIFVGNPEGKRRRWKDNIRMDLRGKRMGGCGMDSSGSG
jgi:hypothetical protein